MIDRPYFVRASLLARFEQAIEHAQMESLHNPSPLSLGEVAWLGRLAGHDPLPSDMRVQALVNAQPAAASCLLITHVDEQKPAAYLFSPLHGVKAFDTLALLHSDLQRERQALGLSLPPPRFEPLGANVLTQWAALLMQQHVAQLTRFEQALASLPGVQSTLDGCLDVPFATLLKGVENIATHRLRIERHSDNTVVRTLGLGQAALCNLAGSWPVPGLIRRFPAIDGQTSITFNSQCETALGTAVEALPAALATAIERWCGTHPLHDPITHLDSLALALCDGFIRSLLHALAQGTISVEEFDWLRGAVLPATSPPLLAMLDYAHGHGNERQHHDQAGVLTVCSDQASRPACFQYAPHTGLQRFGDVRSLRAASLDALKGTRRPVYFAQTDWTALVQAAEPALELTQLDTPAFRSLATSIVDMMQRELSATLARPRPTSDQTLAALEDALDIRAMVDSRLPGLDKGGRWPMLGAPSATADWALPTQHSSDPFGWKLQIGDLNQWLTRLQSGQPSLSDCIHRLCAGALAVLTEGSLRPETLLLSIEGKTLTLAKYLLMRRNQTASDLPSPLPAAVDKRGALLDWPAASELQQVVSLLEGDLPSVYRAQLQGYDHGTQRLGMSLIDVHQQRTALCDAALRIDIASERKQARVPSDLIGLLQAALDHTAQVQVHTIDLQLRDKPVPVRLHGCYALHHPTAAATRWLLWSPLFAVCDFASQAELSQSLTLSMTSSQERAAWLSLIGPRSRYQVEEHLLSVAPHPPVTITLTPIESHLLTHMLEDERQLRAERYEFSFKVADACKLEPELFERFLDREAQVANLDLTLQRLESTVTTLRVTERMPDWLQKATSTELDAFMYILQSCTRVADPQYNYLFDIPNLADFARDKLSIVIQADHPRWPSNPDDIEITLKQYTTSIPSPGELPSLIPAATHVIRQSLSDCALTHFAKLNVASITVSSKKPYPGATLPTANEVRALIDTLDLGSQYRQLLETRLSPSSPYYLKRREAYRKTLLPYLMAETFQYRLQNTLSATAFYYLAHTLLMPDAVARPPFAGVKLELCQLQLRAAPDLEPDTVLGLYLAGPQDHSKGPIVLYNAYAENQVAQEFKDQAVLLDSLKTDKALQKVILARLPAGVRARYAHNGFLHPHLQWSSADLFDFSPDPAPVQLERPPIKGNAIHVLFEENLKVLKLLANSRTVSTAQADWNAFRYLMTLGAEQVSMFLPAHLGLLINTWQSTEWLKSSVSAASQKNWGESMAELATALLMLVSSREPTSFKEKPGHAPNAKPEQASTRSTMHTNSLESRLSLFEAVDVQLQDTRLEPFGLYRDTTTQKLYAVVTGNIYEVHQVDRQWRIVKDGAKGPAIRQDAEQHWQLDMQEGLRGGGFADFYEKTFADADIQERFITLAEGMPAIRSTHFLKYQMLERAHQQARDYLSQCLQNLNTTTPWEPLHSEVEARLARAFDTPSTPRIVATLRDYAQRILNELLSADLAPQTSKRYVVGMNRAANSLTSAFTYVFDPRKRIYLTERFFTLPTKVQVYGTPSETQMLVHQQAVTLIHELSHLKLKTADIAYVESSTPFLDELDISTKNGRDFYNSQREAKRQGLSLHTSNDRLFTFYDVETGVWRDLSHEDGRGKQVILKLTNCTTLQDARTVFRTDASRREAIIFANADSLSLLISELGRKPLHAAAPTAP